MKQNWVVIAPENAVYSQYWSPKCLAVKRTYSQTADRREVYTFHPFKLRSYWTEFHQMFILPVCSRIIVDKCPKIRNEFSWITQFRGQGHDLYWSYTAPSDVSFCGRYSQLTNQHYCCIYHRGSTYLHGDHSYEIPSRCVDSQLKTIRCHYNSHRQARSVLSLCRKRCAETHRIFYTRTHTHTHTHTHKLHKKCNLKPNNQSQEL